MARFNDTVKVTPDSLRVFSAALRKLADIQDAQAAAMEAAEMPAIEAKSLKSALLALVNLGKFIGGATTSFCDQINEDGVSELEGAVLQFRRYLKRGKDQIEKGEQQKPSIPMSTAIDKHVKPRAGTGKKNERKEKES